jgi:RNA-splicing ligase RtcB
MKPINYSAEPDNKLYSWLPHDLSAEAVVFFPDACPGKSPLPTGTAVRTFQTNWRKFAVSDCGCGMQLLRSGLKWDDFRTESWDKVMYELKANKGNLGDLGSGNHFLDAIVSQEDESLYFLIHTGSREESKLVEDLIDNASKFDDVFTSTCNWAENNRTAIADILRGHFGELELIMDKSHNSYEILDDDSVIIRKGAVKLLPGEVTVIPSNMDGDVVLVRAKDSISSVLNSMSHGTGRVMSRGEAKEHAESYDYAGLRKRIYIPQQISNDSIKTEAPFCYRDLDSCLALISELVDEVERFSVIAYIGQL